MDFKGDEQCLAVGNLPDGYESSHHVPVGAIVFEATRTRGWNGNWSSKLGGTEVCRLFATDFRHRIPLIDDGSAVFGNDSCNSSFEKLENDYGLDAQGIAQVWTIVSASFLSALIVLIRRTCRILGLFLCGHPLRGFRQGCKLKTGIRTWMAFLLILVIAIQVVACQLFVNGGVHIRPDLLSATIQVEAAITCGALFARLGLHWRRDHIGPCTLVGTRRFSPSHHRKGNLQYRAIFFCFCILGSHATKAIENIRFSNHESTGHDSVEHSHDVHGSSFRAHRTTAEPEEISAFMSAPHGSRDTCVPGSHSNTGREMQALPEADDHLVRSGEHLSSPCEGTHYEPALGTSLEGEGQQSAFLGANSTTVDEGTTGSVDSRPPFLGDFVFRAQTQDLNVSELRHSAYEQQRKVRNFVFEHEPIRAKAWFAPDGGCSAAARDTDIPVDLFGNVQEHLCSVWSDKIPIQSCSVQSVWPQPYEHFADSIVHFLAFSSHGPVAILVRQNILSHGNPQRTDFCACAVPQKMYRSGFERLSQTSLRRGALVDLIAASGKGWCTLRQVGKLPDKEWGNTATHMGEDMSFMQVASSFASMVGQARFEYAVENQCSIHPIADYTRQNFVKKDVLRQWFRGLPQRVDGDCIRIALWIVELRKEVTYFCKYVLLDDTNWSRQFRNIWRNDFGFSTPEIAVVEPQPPLISNAAEMQIHVLAMEHNRMPVDQVAHLYDIWWTAESHFGTGREFLARRAVRTKRSASVWQIAEVLGLVNVKKEQHFYALHRMEDGRPAIKFMDQQILRLPDFSYVDLIVHEQMLVHSCPTDGDEHGKDEGTSLGSPGKAHQPYSREGDNTATPVQDDDLTGFMQTAVQIEAAMCFEPVRTPIQLSSRGDPSWRLWNHFARDRMRTLPQLDEMAAWFFPEGHFVQSIPLTLFSSRPGSPTVNDPIYLWEHLGGKSIPIVLMVYPNPDPLVMPYEHLIFLPLTAHDENQRAFVIDLVDPQRLSKFPLERVAVRGAFLTPRKVASMLGYRCNRCRTACRARRELPTFVDDQEIRYPTGSYVVLSLMSSAQDSPAQGHPQSSTQEVICTEGDEAGLYQFVPPPRQGSHGDSEAYFWVRNTVVHQPALLNTVLRIGVLTNLHWPLIVVHLHGRPVEVRTFGFEAREQVESDDIRTRFRELYVDQFRTDEVVSVGPVGLDMLQYQRVCVHTVHMIAFRGRISFSARPILIWVKTWEEGQVETRAELATRTCSKAGMITLADLEAACTRPGKTCRVFDDEGIEFGDQPIRVREWSRILIYVEDSRSIQVCGGSASRGVTPQPAPANFEENDQFFLMQSMTNHASSYQEYDMVNRYAFSHVGMFITDPPVDTSNIETYCHLWRDRNIPKRDRQPVILRRAGSARYQLAAVWATVIHPDQLRLVPVRPIPDFGLGPSPTVLALDYEEDQVIPVLFDYTSDNRVFTGTGLIDCAVGFPEVRALFDHLVPDNRCRTETSCIVRANGRHFVPGQHVMLYEGIFLRLDEEDLDATTTEDVVSTDYEAGASHESTTGISSDTSMQPLPPGSAVEQSWADFVPLWATTGPFFDRTSEGTLFVVDHDLDPEVALGWFEAIATQRTIFQQIDQFYLESPDTPASMVFFVVGNEWHNSGFLSRPPPISDHMAFMGAIRNSLFDEFPVHVLLNLWLVVPNLSTHEQYGATDRYLVVDYDCPPDQVSIVVIIQDPEEPDFERHVIRVRTFSCISMLERLLSVRQRTSIVRSAMPIKSCPLEPIGQHSME